MDRQAKILIAGASGFIGRRLVARLSQQLPLRCLSRRDPPAGTANLEYCRADLCDPASLAAALRGSETVYYLVHSLDAGVGRLAEKDRRAAGNFVVAAEAAGVRRVIYLSGLGEGDGALSEHLQSRHEVAEILSAGRFQTTVLRAAIIIGAGGSSFEMLRFLVKTQPMLPDPPQLDTLCQPIAVENVINYLVGCLQQGKTAGKSFDIGGPEVLSYREMLKQMAVVAQTFNLYWPVPLFSSRLASRLIGLFSAVDADVAQALLNSLSQQVVCQENRIRELLPQQLLSYRQAVESAFAEKAQGKGEVTCCP